MIAFKLIEVLHELTAEAVATTEEIGKAATSEIAKAEGDKLIAILKGVNVLASLINEEIKKFENNGQV